MNRRREALRKRRVHVGHTQLTLGNALGLSRVTISHWEQGSQSISTRYRPALARELRVSLVELDALLDPATPPSINGYLVAATVSTYESLVEGAGCLRQVETFTIPGLLQTDEYSATVEREGLAVVTDEQVMARVQKRKARQRVLERQPEPLLFEVVLGEFVLHNHFDAPAMMAAQLDHLIEQAARPNVMLRVLPVGPALAAARGGFELLCRPGESDPFIAYAYDLVRESAYVDNERLLAGYAETYRLLQEATLTETASIRRIEEIGERFR